MSFFPNLQRPAPEKTYFSDINDKSLGKITKKDGTTAELLSKENSVLIDAVYKAVVYYKNGDRFEGDVLVGMNKENTELVLGPKNGAMFYNNGDYYQGEFNSGLGWGNGYVAGGPKYPEKIKKLTLSKEGDKKLKTLLSENTLITSKPGKFLPEDPFYDMVSNAVGKNKEFVVIAEKTGLSEKRYTYNPLYIKVEGFYGRDDYKKQTKMSVGVGLLNFSDDIYFGQIEAPYDKWELKIPNASQKLKLAIQEGTTYIKVAFVFTADENFKYKMNSGGKEYDMDGTLLNAKEIHIYNDLTKEFLASYENGKWNLYGYGEELKASTTTTGSNPASKKLSDESLKKGQTKIQQGDLRGALVDFDAAITADGSNANAYLWRGNAKMYLRDIVGAQKDLEQALKLDPKLYHAHITLGQITMSQQNMTEAKKHYDKAVELAPKNDTVYVARGGYFMAQNDAASAQADMSKAYTINKNNVVALFNLAKIDAATNKLEDAITKYNKVLGMAKTEQEKAEVYLELSKIKAYQQKMDEALDYINKCINALPQNNQFVAIAQRGMIYAQKGDYDKAIVDLEIVSRQPQMSQYLLQLAEVYFLKGDKNQACMTVKRAARTVPDARNYIQKFCGQ